jgi:outer membrane usher protein FimD/PapC
VFAGDQINNSFAVVGGGDVGRVPVPYERRSAGRTDPSDRLLVPSLLSCQNNRLAVDATRPPDVAVGQISRQKRC